jgi:hypothetical protein
MMGMTRITQGSVTGGSGARPKLCTVLMLVADYVSLGVFNRRRFSRKSCRRSVST